MKLSSRGAKLYIYTLSKGVLMNIQVNCDHNIKGGQDLNAFVESSLTEAFDRFNRAITRIEVHLSDENAGKTGGNDKKCLLEARVSNYAPVVVSHHADSLHEAIEGATTKLMRSLDDMVGKMTDHNSSHKDFMVEKDADSESDLV